MFPGPVTATQQTAQWDMQTAIVDAFKSILPLEARPQPAMSSGNSAAAISAAHEPASLTSPSSEPSHVGDLSTAAANDPVASQADDSQEAAGSVPPAVLANDLRLAAQFSASLKAGVGCSAQADASMPAAAQGNKSRSAEANDSLPTQDSSSLPVQTRDAVAAQTPDPPAAAFPQPDPAIIPKPASDASAGVAVTAQPEVLESAAVQAAKAKAAADIVAAVRAARKAAAAAVAPADSTAAPADADSAAMPAIANSAAPATTAAAAAAVPAAATVSAPAATVTKAPSLPGAASTSAMAAVTSAPTAGPTVPAAAPPAMAAPAAASASDTAAGLPSILSAALAAWSSPAAPIFSNSIATASTPAAAAAAAAAAVPNLSFIDTKGLLQSSVPQAPASVTSRPVASTQSLHPQAVPASDTAAVVKLVSSAAVSVAASPGTAPVPVSLPGTTVGGPPIASSLATFLSAHAPRALLQGCGSSSSSVPVGSFTLTPPMSPQTNAIRAVANSPGGMATWLVSERPASLTLGAGLSGTGLPLLPHITPTPSPAAPLSQLPRDLTVGPDQAEGFTSIPASPSLFSPAPRAAPAMAKLQGSKSSKKRSREQAQLKRSEFVAVSQTKGDKQAPFSFLPTRESQQVSASLAPPTLAQRTFDNDPHPKRLHSDDGIPISKELAIMRKAHGDGFIPRVGADAVSPQLRDVKSLVLHKQHKYNLLDICNAIGYFAIGQQQNLEIFLGDLRNSLVHQQQVGTSVDFNLLCLNACFLPFCKQQPA